MPITIKDSILKADIVERVEVMKKLIKAISLIMTVVLLVSVFSACSLFGKPKKNIGLIQYAQTAALDRVYEGFIDGMKREGYKKDRHYTLEEFNAGGDKKACGETADRFIAEPKDLIVAFSSQAVQAVYRKDLTVPTVFAAVPDPEKIPVLGLNTAPNGNITGASDLAPIKDQIDYMHSVLPEIKQIAIVYFSDEISARIQASSVATACLAYNISSTECTFDDLNAVDFVLSNIIDRVDALYIPSGVTIYGSIEKIAKTAAEHNVPVFCADENMVKAGGFFSYGADYYEVGKKAAQMSAKILRGEAQPGSMPVEYLSEFSVVVNQDVMNKLGITLPEDIKAKAKFVTANP